MTTIENSDQKNQGEILTYYVDGHSHGDHSHFFLSKVAPKPKSTTKNPSINRNDEGCPCCVQAIDLDEVTTALSKVVQSSEGKNDNPYGQLADFDSAAHWGIFLGIAGPFALLGLTAAYRNIKGTINTKKKLNAIIQHLQKDIEKQKADLKQETNLENKQKRFEVIQRLEAFLSSLKYSKFDAKFNLTVPGVINGVASTIVLSSAIVSSPWALPVIALYAGSQTLRNNYDLWRTWNEILPEKLQDGIEINIGIGTRKVNQITNSKRRFYAVNSFGFVTFTAGAIMATIGAFPGPLSPVLLPVGLALLTVGAIATGITNNIWTAKFKPRNAALGVDRKGLNSNQILAEIGHRREVKKLLKNYRDSHLPKKLGKRFTGALYSALPFCQKRGAKFLHKTNQSRMKASDSNWADKIDLIERMVGVSRLLKNSENQNATDILMQKISNLQKVNNAEKPFSFNQNDDIYLQLFNAFKELKVDNFILNKFIKNLIGADSLHDTSIKSKEEYCQKLKAAIGKEEIFRINDDGSVIFKPEIIGTNDKFKTIFSKSLEECLLFDYVEKLKYEQYGLNDFYWALQKQNKRKPNLLVSDCEKIDLKPTCNLESPPVSKNINLSKKPGFKATFSAKVFGGQNHSHKECDHCH